jgi:hypothetical protein
LTSPLKYITNLLNNFFSQDLRKLPKSADFPGTKPFEKETTFLWTAYLRYTPQRQKAREPGPERQLSRRSGPEGRGVLFVFGWKLKRACRTQML